MKISMYYGKKIISVGGKSGYVLGVTEQDGILKCIVCADGNENEFCVDATCVKSGKGALKFTGGEIKRSGTPVRLGKPVFDYLGNYVGKLTDFTVENNIITYAHAGSKKLSAKDIVCGDAVIIKNSARILRSDVKSKGKTIIRRGTPLTEEVLARAGKQGEYVQTNLKTL